jgi:hypothetical protein
MMRPLHIHASAKNDSAKSAAEYINKQAAESQGYGVALDAIDLANQIYWFHDEIQSCTKPIADSLVIDIYYGDEK